jgi:hypothetical protein
LPALNPIPKTLLIETVARREAPVRRTSTSVGGRGAVAAEHLAGSPAGQSHQVRLAPAQGEPCVREGMAKLVGMQPWQAGLVAAAA